ncbi:MAG: MFS transporter [Deltaproteobacteria bacterium]
MIEIPHRKLTRDSQILITAHGIQSIIRIIIKVFLGIYFFKLTNGNLCALASFYAIYYAVDSALFFIMLNYMKSGNRAKPYRFGVFIFSLFFLAILCLKDNAAGYIQLLAVVYGAATAFYYFPYNLLRFELNSSTARGLYFGYEKAIEDILSIVIPLIVGSVITISSYQPVFMVVIICTGITFAFSYKLSNSEISKQKSDIKGFVKLLKDNKEGNVFSSYVTEFLRGLNYFGVLPVLIPIIIFMKFSNEFTLGILSSIFSAVSILTSVIIAKFLHGKYFRNLIIVSGILLFAGTGLLIFDISERAIIIYNIAFSIAIPVLTILQSTYSWNSIDKTGLAEYKEEHFAIREAVSALGRVSGFILLFFAGLFGNNIHVVRIALVIVSLSILLIPIHARKIGKLE